MIAMPIDTDTIANFIPLVFAGAIWYLTKADHTRAALGRPLADAVYRQPFGARITLGITPEQEAEIVAHVKERIADC